MKFRIGAYYEMSQGKPTPHQEAVIEAESLETARGIAEQRFGWGAWAFLIMPCALCGFVDEENALKVFNGRNLCEQCYTCEVDNPELALPPPDGY